MAEYVDVESVRQMLEDAQIITDGENNGYCTEDVDLSLIKREDVAPVRHGRWVHGIRRGVNFDVSGFECSSYGGWFMLRTNYCPSCGAKMEG